MFLYGHFYMEETPRSSFIFLFCAHPSSSSSYYSHRCLQTAGVLRSMDPDCRGEGKVEVSEREKHLGKAEGINTRNISRTFPDGALWSRTLSMDTTHAWAVVDFFGFKTWWFFKISLWGTVFLCFFSVFTQKVSQSRYIVCVCASFLLGN